MVDSALPTGTRRIATLIDGDNAQPSLIEKILAETGKYGQSTIRRIYGDWTTANMKGWKDTLHIYAFQPIQQFRYTVGKNATDSAMIIDAMDILHEGLVDGFSLVSSDSDYTRLATRIRQQGFFVMGIGRQSTPRAFVSACEVFVYTENLLPQPILPEPLVSKPTTGRKRVSTAEVSAPDLFSLLKSAFDMAVQEDGWAHLGTVGNRLRQLDPGFDPRTYGHRQLSVLIRASSDTFETKDEKNDGGPPIIYVRPRE